MGGAHVSSGHDRIGARAGASAASGGVLRVPEVQHACAKVAATRHCPVRRAEVAVLSGSYETAMPCGASHRTRRLLGVHILIVGHLRRVHASGGNRSHASSPTVHRAAAGRLARHHGKACMALCRSDPPALVPRATRTPPPQRVLDAGACRILAFLRFHNHLCGASRVPVGWKQIAT